MARKTPKAAKKARKKIRKKAKKSPANKVKYDDTATAAIIKQQREYAEAPRKFTAKYPEGEEIEWTVSVSFGAIEEVKKDCDGVDLLLMDHGEPTLYETLYSDLMLLATVLYSLCKEQHPEVTKDKFFKGLKGDTLFLADRALRAECVDFFIGIRRPDLARVMIVHSVTIEAAAENALAQLTNIDLKQVISAIAADAVAATMSEGKSTS